MKKTKNKFVIKLVDEDSDNNSNVEFIELETTKTPKQINDICNKAVGDWYNDKVKDDGINSVYENIIYMLEKVATLNFITYEVEITY